MGNFNYGRKPNNRRNGRRAIQGFNFDPAMFVKKGSTAVAVNYVAGMEFNNLGLDPVLLKNIKIKGYITPTNIQDKVVPEILAGNDVLGIADTGTGKTAAFLIPLINKHSKVKSTKTLIVTPTRELAEQINQELRSLTKDMRIFSIQCIGGVDIRRQIYSIQRGVDFVIGTPGRLKDLIERRVLDLRFFNSIVLDEVDRMLDMGFVNEIKELISYLPQNKQSLCFSATVNPKVEAIVKSLLKPDYFKVSVKTGETAETVDQDIIKVATREEKIPKLEELLKLKGFDKVIVFVNTKRGVDKLDKVLYQKGYKVTSIHGQKPQSRRKQAIEGFKTGRYNILIATDVASRGLDISSVTHVINFDIPMSHDDYIHRVGRTGRGNQKGKALTFVAGGRYRY